MQKQKQKQSDSIPEPGNVVVPHGHSDCCGPGPPLGMSINNASCVCKNSGRRFNGLLLHVTRTIPTFFGNFCFKKCGICLRSLGSFLFPFKRLLLAARNSQPLTSHRNSAAAYFKRVNRFISFNLGAPWVNWKFDVNYRTRWNYFSPSVFAILHICGPFQIFVSLPKSLTLIQRDPPRTAFRKKISFTFQTSSGINICAQHLKPTWIAPIA